MTYDPCSACEVRQAGYTRQTAYGPVRLCRGCAQARDANLLADRAQAIAERNREDRRRRRAAALLGWKRRCSRGAERIGEAR